MKLLVFTPSMDVQRLAIEMDGIVMKSDNVHACLLALRNSKDLTVVSSPEVTSGYYVPDDVHVLFTLGAIKIYNHATLANAASRLKQVNDTEGEK